MEHGAQSVFPQYFADMFGWPQLAAEVASVYRALPENERADAVFFGRNYGEAAAVDILGPQYGARPPSAATTTIFSGVRAAFQVLW